MNTRRMGLVVGLALVTLAASGAVARASGYHPAFDRAVKEADWILLHEIVSDHVPKDVLLGIPKAVQRYPGRVVLVRVKQSFKGPFRKGDLLYIWDRSYRSSASYFLTKGRDNLTFLIKPKRRPYIVGVTPRDDTKYLAVPIRNLNGTFGRGRAGALKTWLRLLDLTSVGSQLIPLADLRAIVATAKSPALLRYALTHWPGTLTGKDVRAIKALLRRSRSRPWVTAAAMDLLRKQGVGLSVKTLRDQLAHGPQSARQQMLKQITRANVAAVRDVLWTWASRDEPSGVNALLLLARLERRYLIKKLRAHRLPFWLEIPALAALGSQLGRHYSKAAMKIDQWQLSYGADLVKGKTFGAAYSLQTRKPVWAELITLVVPLLSTMKQGPRELTLAIAHTWGYRVTRVGKKAAKLGKRGRAPLSITLQHVPGKRYKVKLIERARVPVWVCPRTEKRVVITRAKNGVTSMDATLGSWDNTAAPRTCFKRRKGIVHTELVDFSLLVKNVRAPGTYELSVSVLHRSSGIEYGLNAWTGMVYSPPLTISLP